MVDAPLSRHDAALRLGARVLPLAAGEVAEYPRRGLISRRLAWRIAYAAVDAVLLASAIWATLLLLSALFARLPPIA